MLKLNTILSFSEPHLSDEDGSTLTVYEDGYLGFDIKIGFIKSPGSLILVKADIVAFFNYCQQVCGSSRFNEYQPGNLFVTDDGVLIKARPDSQANGYYYSGVRIELFPEQGNYAEYSMFLSASSIDEFFNRIKRKGLL